MMRAMLLFSVGLMAAGVSTSVASANDVASVIVVVGAPGTDEYEAIYRKWSAQWGAACDKAGARLIEIGVFEQTQQSDRDQLREAIEREADRGAGPLWLIFIGHGTYDGRNAKFNLRGPDFTEAELAEWLKPVKRPLAIINTASSSAPFLPVLSGDNRVIITATKSGHEQNFTRFGGFFSHVICESDADLDKDGQTSLLEAFLIAARRTADFYESEGRLATEFALLDDNGDGLGTRADFYVGVRPVKRAKEGAALDGHRAHQFHLIYSEQEKKMPPDLRRQRDELELKVLELRDRKSQFKDEAEYNARMEQMLIGLARIYQQVDDATVVEKKPR